MQGFKQLIDLNGDLQRLDFIIDSAQHSQAFHSIGFNLRWSLPKIPFAEAALLL